MIMPGPGSSRVWRALAIIADRQDDRYSGWPVTMAMVAAKENPDRRASHRDRLDLDQADQKPAF
jgi:hypothetical protein